MCLAQTPVIGPAGSGGAAPTATSSTLGIVKPDNTTITISAGVLSAVVGGTGTVTSFSAGNLSPIFTSSVATPTTTPAHTFTLSTAPAHTFLGNTTVSTAAPSYSAITAADVPTLNQSTTGNAATATTAVNLSGSQTANFVYASPNGSPGTGAFRALVPADLPTGSAITWTAKNSYGGGTLFEGGVNAQVGTSYTVVATDEAKLLTFSNAAAIAVTLPQATTAGFTVGAVFHVFNIGAGTATITPTTSTINGVATLVLTTGQGADIYSDGTNYSIQKGAGSGGGGGVSLSPAASQTILAANTTTTPLIIDTPASPTVDAFAARINGSSKIRVDQFGIVQFDAGGLASNSGIIFTSGADFGVTANKNGTTSNVNLSSGWAGSAIAGDVVAVTSGTHAVADCATSCVNAFGVVIALPNTNDQVAVAPSQVTVNLDATYTPVGGWFACSSATTAGKAIVQAAACAAGRQIGYVTQAGTSVTTIPIVLQFK